MLLNLFFINKIFALNRLSAQPNSPAGEFMIMRYYGGLAAYAAAKIILTVERSELRGIKPGKIKNNIPYLPNIANPLWLLRRHVHIRDHTRIQLKIIVQEVLKIRGFPIESAHTSNDT